MCCHFLGVFHRIIQPYETLNTNFWVVFNWGMLIKYSNNVGYTHLTLSLNFPFYSRKSEGFHFDGQSSHTGEIWFMSFFGNPLLKWPVSSLGVRVRVGNLSPRLFPLFVSWVHNENTVKRKLFCNDMGNVNWKGRFMDCHSFVGRLAVV